jgi:hypothetical protein
MRKHLVDALRKQAAQAPLDIGQIKWTGTRNLDTPFDIASQALISPLPSVLGGVAGSIADAPTPEEVGEMGLKSMIPGVGAFRQNQIAKAVSADYERRNPGKTSAFWPERFGKVTSSLLGAGAAGMGAATLLQANDGRGPLDDMSPNNKALVVLATLAGAALPNMVGAVSASFTRTRKRPEQDEAESTGAKLADYLVPGAATYNDWKRLGHGYSKYQEGGE